MEPLLHKERNVRKFRDNPAYFCGFILVLKYFKCGKNNNLK